MSRLARSTPVAATVSNATMPSARTPGRPWRLPLRWKTAPLRLPSRRHSYHFRALGRKPQYSWPPMIRLYTGTRVNEVCQLEFTDIIQSRGIWWIASQKTADKDLVADLKKKRRCRQSMEGAGCMRIVPIASPLLDAGCLEFVEVMRPTARRPRGRTGTTPLRGDRSVARSTGGAMAAR